MFLRNSPTSRLQFASLSEQRSFHFIFKQRNLEGIKISQDLSFGEVALGRWAERKACFIGVSEHSLPVDDRWLLAGEYESTFSEHQSYF